MRFLPATILYPLAYACVEISVDYSYQLNPNDAGLNFKLIDNNVQTCGGSMEAPNYSATDVLCNAGYSLHVTFQKDMLQPFRYEYNTPHGDYGFWGTTPVVQCTEAKCGGEFVAVLRKMNANS
jgi:hypothetical protein